MLPSFRSMVIGVCVTTMLLGLSAFFVKGTLPYQAPVNGSPEVQLSPAELAAASSFPEYDDAIPVINYHDISDRTSTYSTSAQTFAHQLAILRAAGFHTVTIKDVYDLITGRRPSLPSKPLLITFDDGVVTQYSNATASLKKYDFKAVSFVITHLLATKQPSYYLTPEQLTSIRKSGAWEIGSHTHNGHGQIPNSRGTVSPWLTTRLRRTDGSVETLDQWRDRVITDLATSNQELAPLESGLKAFAYPFSSTSVPNDDPVLTGQAVRAVAGQFDLAFTAFTKPTVAISADSPRWLLPRYEVTYGLEPLELLNALKVMVPTPLATSIPAQWGLHQDDSQKTGTCAVDGASVTLTSKQYVRCYSALNGRSWTDYSVTTKVSGLNGNATAIVAVRDSGSARWEVDVSEGRWAVRTMSGDWDWVNVAEGDLPGPNASSHQLTIQVLGDSLTVNVDGQTITRQKRLPSSGWGTVSLGLAAQRGKRVVTFEDLQVRARPAETP